MALTTKEGQNSEGSGEIPVPFFVPEIQDKKSRLIIRFSCKNGGDIELNREDFKQLSILVKRLAIEGKYLHIDYINTPLS